MPSKDEIKRQVADHAARTSRAAKVAEGTQKARDASDGRKLAEAEKRTQQGR